MEELQERRHLASNPDSQWSKVTDKNGDWGEGGRPKVIKAHQKVAPVSYLEQEQVQSAGGSGGMGGRFALWAWPPSSDHLVLLICLFQRKERTEPGSKIHRNFYWIIERLRLKSL